MKQIDQKKHSKRKELSAMSRWQRRIKMIFKQTGRFTPMMEIPIFSLASTLMAVEVCNSIIVKVSDNIDAYRDGELPSVFIRQKDALNSCAMQLRALLVVAGLSDGDERTAPLMELLEKLSLNND